MKDEQRARSSPAEPQSEELLLHSSFCGCSVTAAAAQSKHPPEHLQVFVPFNFSSGLRYKNTTNQLEKREDRPREATQLVV